MKANVLLTGGSGFLGRIIHAELVDQGYLVSNLGRSPTNDIVCNLAKESPALNSDFSVVIHCAGKAHSVPRTESEKNEFFRVNVQGTKNLLTGLEGMINPPEILIFISSIAVYGLVKGESINEEQPLEATDPYGRSKIEAEELIRSWCSNSGVRLIIFRLPLLAGKHAPGNLAAMVRGMRKGYYFNIGGGRARKSMVMARDVAKILPLSFLYPGIYNLTDGYHPTFKELENKISVALDMKSPAGIPFWLARFLAWLGDIIDILAPGKAPINTAALEKITTTLTFDDQKARRKLGWNPKKVIDAFEID